MNNPTVEQNNDQALFSKEDWLRYSRHIQLPGCGPEGQQKLRQSHALIVGSGGLGSPVCLYLAAAGIGEITLIDHDIIEISNLQRQILFNTDNLGESKAMVGADALRKLNPSININAINEKLTATNAQNVIQAANIVLDCTDNLQSRYLINDVCHQHNTPWLYASIHQFSGQCSFFSNETPCFCCLFPEPPEEIHDCNTGGVLGVLPGLLGTIQANEAIKYLCGLHTPLLGSLLLVDALDVTFQKIALNKNKGCPVCGENNAKESTESDPSRLSRLAMSEPKSHPIDHAISASDFLALKDDKATMLLDVRSEVERKAFHLGGAHIPIDSLKTHIHELPSTKKIICYCQSGARSQSAADILVSNGIDAVSVLGGIEKILKHD